MSTTPEAIAAKLEAASRDRWAFGLDLAGAAAELRRLAAVEAERDKEKASRQDAQRQLYEERARLYEMVRTEQVKTGQALAERDQLRAEVEALRAGAVSAQRVELVAAWNDLPDSIRCHPGLKRLFRACQVA